MLFIDMTTKKVNYELFAYFDRDFCNFIKSRKKFYLISYSKPLWDGGIRYTYATLDHNGKKIYDLLKEFLASRNVNIEDFNVYYE